MAAPRRRGRRPVTPEENRAVELRAMQVVRAHYESEGWAVEDVSASRPYDLVCRLGAAECHVEVKGLTGLPPLRIGLTANEVAHARTCPRVALAIVSGVRLTPIRANPRAPPAVSLSSPTRGKWTTTASAPPPTRTQSAELRCLADPGRRTARSTKSASSQPARTGAQARPSQLTLCRVVGDDATMLVRSGSRLTTVVSRGRERERSVGAQRALIVGRGG